LAILRDSLAEFDSLVGGKITFDSEAIQQNLPQRESSREFLGGG
jgi:hypothetical protein